MEKYALRLTASDTVATVMEDTAAGDAVAVTDSSGRTVAELTALDRVGQGHKIALEDMAPGQSVIKYGCPIGAASQPIRRGEHVHTDNLSSRRGRGDL